MRFRWNWLFVLAATFVVGVPLGGGFMKVLGEEAGEEAGGEEGEEEEISEPDALDTVEVPIPEDLSKYVRNKEAAIVLGKALFWDQSLGSDGSVACATCHFHAGADVRTKNTLAPGGHAPAQVGSSFDKAAANAQSRGANVDLTAADFPFHKKIDPLKKTFSSSNVERDTREVVGSQGVRQEKFLGLSWRLGHIERGKPILSELFSVSGVNVRQSTGRNAPTTINSVFNERQFWDGRADRYFNGVNPFGRMDPNAHVWVNDGGVPRKKRILIDKASLASQAVGPPLDTLETSFIGRSFPKIAEKLLGRYALEQQLVHRRDSVLGRYSTYPNTGLNVSYRQLIRRAFEPKWWNSRRSIKIDGKKFSQMEANFSLFWGLSIMLYERTLVSDDSKFDRVKKGTATFTPKEEAGFQLFMNEGKCVNCHQGPEFTQAAIGQISKEFIELMPMQFNINVEKFYDNGFYNIGVSPTAADLGVGGKTPFGTPLSYTLRNRSGEDIGGTVSVPKGAPVAVNGAFKTPGLRNIELTGPFMHNGGMRTLEEVVEFYARGTDFKNRADKDPDVDGFDADSGRIEELVAFLKTLTDERVRYQKAPFDHPELFVPNGHRSINKRWKFAKDDFIRIPEVGENGGKKLRTFAEILDQGGFSNRTATGK